MTISWLHLSDFHACTPRFAWDADRVIQELVEDLGRLQADHGLRPDLLFFTGDAAFGEVGNEPGEKIRDQFEHFAHFLHRARAAFEPEIPIENVFLVPGNHDVHRGWVTPDQTEWLERQESIDPVRTLIAAGGLQWRRYVERLDAYRDFLREQKLDHLLEDSDRLLYSTVRAVRGLRVGIAGFNSAWSCCRDNERGRLWMAGRWQQGVLRQKITDADLSIALVHHPPDWLVEYEDTDFGRGLEQDFHFLLHGHQHRDWVLNTAQGYTVLAAGACYERSDSEHNGYNFVRLEPRTRHGEVWLRRYDSTGGGWIPRLIANGKTDERGVWKIRGAELRRPTPAPPVPPAAAEDAPQNDDVTPATDLDRYLQRLRAAHRDLPIAGFETGVSLPIHIDEVYIPLRARAARTVLERDHHGFGALRELEAADADRERDIAFDESLRLAAEHRLRGAVVLGDPGSGKTTLLKHFVLAATDPLIGPAALGLPAKTVPVLIELRRLDDPAAGLKPALEAAVESADMALDDPKAFAHRLLDGRPLLILVDGLDEVPDPWTRTQVSRWLEDALRRLPESTFVVTSRYAGYRGDARLDGHFLELHVRDIEESAARRFLVAWYVAVEAQAELGRDAEVAEALGREASDDLAQKIFEPADPRTSSLRQLARNPLMLQILCLVHRSRKQLPERRVELYRECVLVLLELWRRAKKLSVDLDAPQALRLLRPLAYQLHRTDRREAHLDELLPHLKEPLRELRRLSSAGTMLLETIRDQSGVLVALGQSHYGFLHLSFQEYLCALYIQDRFPTKPELLTELAGHFGEPWWREVILLALGLDAPSLFEPLMTELLKLGVLARDVQLADDCLRDALAATPGPFLRALQGGLGDAGERYHSLRLLRALPDWESVEAAEGVGGRELVARLAREDPDRQVRGMAVELLGGDVQTPGLAVTSASERVHEVDGSVLVYVPGGEFTLGTNEDLETYAEEFRDVSKPEHRVVLSPFWIGRYPVTNEQYGRFLEANPDQGTPELWDDKQFNEPEQPVVGVSWLDALAYCRWAELDLPSEAQWEAAARGTDRRPYPWGVEDPSDKLANFNSRLGRTSPVGAYPDGAGPYGTLDQAGNVWEWCRDRWDKDAYKERESTKDPVVSGDDADEAVLRVVRGGSWGFPPWSLHAAFRFGFEAGSRNGNLGFRVVCVSVPEHGS